MNRLSVLLAVAVCLPAPSAAQSAPVAPDTTGYGRWETLGRTALDASGRVFAHRVTRNDETGELRIRFRDGDSTRVVPRGDAPTFSADGRWLAYAVEPTPEERERLEDADEPVRLAAGLIELRTGRTLDFDAVRSFAFDADARFLALHGYAPTEGPEGKGADLRVVELASGTVTSFGNVDAWAWADVGSVVALALATGADAANGVQVWDAASGRLRALDASGSAYAGLAWREDALDLAALRSREPASTDDVERGAHDVLAWRDVTADAAPATLVLGEGAAGVADTLEIVAARTPGWSDDGAMISLGLRPTDPAERAATGADAADTTAGTTPAAGADSTAAGTPDEDADLPGVQIWHTSDVRIFPQQQAMRSAAERASLLAVWRVDEARVVQVGTELLADAEILEGWERALEETDTPYPWGAMFGRPYRDVWVVDLDTGERRLALEKVRWAWPSAGGGYLVSFDGEGYRSHDLRTARSISLTEGLPAVFADTVYDTPTDLTPPWDFGPDAWLEGDAGVLLPDRYDLWRVALDGSGAERVTDGAAERVVHRVALAADDDEPGVDPDEALYLALHGEWSERRGYARLAAGALRGGSGGAGAGGTGGGAPGRAVERLVFEDAMLSGLAKADSADVYAWRAMAFDDPPDWFAAGPDLRDPEPLTAINPFFAEEPWGTSRLVDFTSEAGVPLQAVLYLPPGFREGTPVPTIVYTYEMRSPTVHVYANPNERSYYNFTDWTRAGYAVLQPDIVYRAREPGISALESVRAAVAKVVEMGVADPDAVGLIGHSWGGYQAAFLPTRTDIFAASVAGAPLTDFLSMMGTIHWNPGVPEVDHWETGQARMEVPYWDDPEAHRRNSPIEKVHELETPMLMAFGDDDGVVDWDQGTQFYNLARRAGKTMVLLVYEGEDHGFRREANQKDYHRRILEWFGHWLKGEPAPAWITEGILLDDLEEEKKRVAGAGGG